MEVSEDQVFRHRAKALMRRRFRAQRSAIPSSAVARRNAALLARLTALPEWQAARAVALFWPIERNNEVDLRPVDAQLREAGVVVAYPIIDPESDRMTFRRVDDVAAMVEAPMGYLEPALDAPLVASLDVIVVPGLAFDPRGYRIGYGGGYYDRALPTHPEARWLGVAFDFQLAADIPNTEHDVPVHQVITDTRCLLIEGAR
ncbi:MAG: 5-formyltetrahydrofolate cyclo-ligase [Polyangiaceae bacterium]